MESNTGDPLYEVYEHVAEMVACNVNWWRGQVATWAFSAQRFGESGDEILPVPFPRRVDYLSDKLAILAAVHDTFVAETDRVSYWQRTGSVADLAWDELYNNRVPALRSHWNSHRTAVLSFIDDARDVLRRNGRFDSWNPTIEDKLRVASYAIWSLSYNTFYISNLLQCPGAPECPRETSRGTFICPHCSFVKGGDLHFEIQRCLTLVNEIQDWHVLSFGSAAMTHFTAGYLATCSASSPPVDFRGQRGDSYHQATRRWSTNALRVLFEIVDADDVDDIASLTMAIESALNVKPVAFNEWAEDIGKIESREVDALESQLNIELESAIRQLTSADRTTGRSAIEFKPPAGQAEPRIPISDSDDEDGVPNTTWSKIHILLDADRTRERQMNDDNDRRKSSSRKSFLLEYNSKYRGDGPALTGEKLGEILSGRRKKARRKLGD